MGAHQSRAQDPFFNYRLFQGVKVSMFEGLSNNADTADTFEGVRVSAKMMMHCHFEGEGWKS